MNGRKKTALRGLSAVCIRAAKPGRIFVCDALSITPGRRMRQVIAGGRHASTRMLSGSERLLRSANRYAGSSVLRSS